MTHLNQIKNYSFSCIFELHEKEEIIIVGLDYKLIKITENCKGGLNSFENVYWVDDVVLFGKQSNGCEMKFMQIFL